MKYLVITFKNRNNLMSFNQLIHSRGINTSIINTPRSVAVSCGLSIKTELNNYNTILNMLKSYMPEGFTGLFAFQRVNGHEQIRRMF